MRRPSTTGLALVLAACSGDATPEHATVTDSAGVQIVESTAAAWSEADAWRIGETASLMIGEDPTSPQEEFTLIKRVFTLPDGRIAVVNASRPPEIRVFNADGTHAHNVGAAGEGPGEMKAIWDVWLAGDTLVVFDPSVSRFTFFDAHGTLLGTTNFEQRSSGISVLPWARFADGSYLYRRNRFIENTEGTTEGRSITLAVRGLADGTVVDTIGRFPESDYITMGDGSRGPGMPRFSKLAVIYVKGDRIYRGMGDTYAVDEFSMDGTHVRSMRRAHTVRPADDALVAALKERELAAAPPQRHEAIEKDYAERPRNPTLAAFGNIWVKDAAGNLWVQDFVTPLDTTNTWTVFDAEGRWNGVVALPKPFMPHEIGIDYILGVYRNELDVETVRRYPLIKP